MDRRTLHDLGGSRGAMRREGAHLHEDEDEDDDKSNFLRGTRSPRRIPTGNAADAAGRSRYQPDFAGGFEGGAMASPASIPTMNTSWDEQSDEEEEMGGSPRRDHGRDLRKIVEATTPTLIDEEDFIGDEEHEREMISLERERLRLTSRAFFGTDESDLRRTPGAQMYKSNFDQESMRRTPGASQMHRSAVTTVMPQDTTGSDAAALGFGLTLATPVAPSNRGGKPLNLSTAWEASEHSSRGSLKASTETDQVTRPPRAPGSAARDHRGAFVTPWNLSKNAQLEGSRGVYSPNTLRLTEDLGNLLLEEDEGVDSSRKVGQLVYEDDIASRPIGEGARDAKQEGSESWTAPYVISMDAPSRVPRSSSNRARRGKTDSSRRSRGLDRPSATRHFEEQGAAAKTGGFLTYAQQPTPVRSVQPQSFGNFPATQFTFGDAPANSSGHYGGAEKADSGAASRLLHFGGAFAPPSKSYGGTFHRPVPSASGSQPNTGTFPQPQDASGQPMFPGSNAPPFGNTFHIPFQQGQPSFQQGQPAFQQGQPSFQQGQPSFQQGQPAFQQGQPSFQQGHPFGSHPSKFQPQFGTQNPMFGGNPTVSQSPTFNFPPQNVGYPMHAGGMHPQPQDFMQNMPVHLHQRSPLPQFGPPQVWPQAMPMQYDGMSMDQANWHGAHGGWPMGEYGYGMPPRTNDSLVVAMTPTPTWTPEVEHVSTDIQTNPFAVRPESGARSTTPSTGQGTKSLNRGKNQRRNTSKKGAKSQSKNDRGQKIDSGNQAITEKKSPTSKKNKKKQSKDRATPPVQGSTSTPTEELTKNTADDPADAKRAELVESPAIRSAFKDFYRKFRTEERSSFKDAEAFAMQAISDGSLPDSIHWRVYLELADLAKRANKFVEARKLYHQVCHLQPYASQGWLEFSKLEEECGNTTICAKILLKGLEFCQYSENLLTRAIKHEEKMGNLGRARELLSRLKHVGIEKVWRTVLEGALLEARAGNDVMSRRVLKYLMHHVPWYGPLYLEAYRLERDLGRSKEALAVVERGLATIPRYGPLWFGAFRLCEEMDLVEQAFRLPQSMAMSNRATFSISKELIWKVHLEAAQMLERASVEYLDTSTDPTAQQVMDLCRKRFAMTILTCPPNLRWKVWLASGRMEVAAGNSDRARRLFLRAHKVVPDKGRAVALLECARLEEFVGDTELANAILCKSRSVSGSDWKVWLESVLLEIRCGNHARAIELAQLALKLHSGTGRLWASLVQLRHFVEGEEAQFESLKLALNAVPKSGEVWCEGARIHFNPFSRTFDLTRARRHLFFATKFTPQYGDGFLETLRLEIVDQWLVPISKMIWEATRGLLVLDEDSDKQEEATKYVFEVSRAVFAICDENPADDSVSDGSPFPKSCIDKGMTKLVRAMLKPAYRERHLNISKLHLRCANADPNYGSLWFHCRAGPTDTARKVLARAVRLMLNELRGHSHIYLSALIRRFAILARFDRDQERQRKAGKSETRGRAVDPAQWEDLVSEAYLSVPSLNAIIDTGNAKYKSETGMDLLESTMTGSDFVSGLVALSKQRPMEEMTLPERRKALFGTDALFS
jgi:tetratricopeptide (TPR) repeat protein